MAEMIALLIAMFLLFLMFIGAPALFVGGIVLISYVTSLKLADMGRRNKSLWNWPWAE